MAEAQVKVEADLRKWFAAQARALQESGGAEVPAALARIEGALGGMQKTLAEVAKGTARPEPEVELSDEELRRIYACVLLAAKDEKGTREAPLKEVFELYCLQGVSARQTALKLDCSKATVMNRLAKLEKIARVPARQLRAYKPFFEQMEKDLREPRARRLRRRDAAEGDGPGEE